MIELKRMVDGQPNAKKKGSLLDSFYLIYLFCNH